MTPEQVIDLLTLIAARDRRTVGKIDVTVWHDDIGDLDYTEAAQAVTEHFREEPDTWLMAGHIRRRVKAARAKRIDAAGTVAEHKALHGRDVADEGAYRAELRRIHRDLGDAGQPPPFRAIEAGRAEAVAPGDTSSYRKLREAWEAERAAQREAEKAAAEARIAEQEAERAATRRVTDAYAALLVLTPEAQADAYLRARDELGDTAAAEDVTIRAAQLADHRQVADLEAATSIRRNLARRGCPNGCPIGTHEPPCRYATGEDT